MRTMVVAFMGRNYKLLWLLAALPMLATAQSKFEVAVVKPFAAGPGNPVSFACRGIDGDIPVSERPRRIPQGRCTGGNSLLYLVSRAYDIDVRRIAGGPA